MLGLELGRAAKPRPSFEKKTPWSVSLSWEERRMSLLNRSGGGGAGTNNLNRMRDGRDTGRSPLQCDNCRLFWLEYFIIVGLLAMKIFSGFDVT